MTRINRSRAWVQKWSSALVLTSVLAGSGAIMAQDDLEPANDDFANATPLRGNAGGSFLTSGFVSGTTVGATSEQGEPNHADERGGKSVWFLWVAPVSGSTTFTTAGSTFDTLLAVYRGTRVRALSEVASNDDAGGLQSSVRFDAVAGTSYYIAIDGYNGEEDFGSAASGLYRLNISTPSSGGGGGPVNNQFAQATSLGNTSSGAFSGTNLGATLESGEPRHAGTGGKSVWYSWTAPARGRVTFTTAGSSFNTVLAAYTGASVNQLSNVAVNDDTTTSTTSSITFAADPNVSYKIAVDGANGATGAIRLNLTFEPGAIFNDLFRNATPLGSASPRVITGSTEGATREQGEPQHGPGSSASVWYTWTAPATGLAEADTRGSRFDTLLGVYFGTSVSTLRTLGTNDDFYGLDSSVLFNAVRGTTYRIAVDGFGGSTGTFTLRVGMSSGRTFNAAPSGPRPSKAPSTRGS